MVRDLFDEFDFFIVFTNGSLTMNSEFRCRIYRPPFPTREGDR